MGCPPCFRGPTRLPRLPSHASRPLRPTVMARPCALPSSPRRVPSLAALARAAGPARNKVRGKTLLSQMCRELPPTTRQRSRALVQTFCQYPNFNKIPMLESSLQYEQTSKETYPCDLKTATLTRCPPKKLGEHLQLSLGDRSTYADVREAQLAYEKTTNHFSQEQILKPQIQAELAQTTAWRQCRWIEFKTKEKAKESRKVKAVGGTSKASGSTQSTIAYLHSTYRPTQPQPTVRRAWDIGNSEFGGDVSMIQITDHETEDYTMSLMAAP